MTMATAGASPVSRRVADPGVALARRPAPPTVLDPMTLVAAYSEHRGAVYRLAYQILGDGPAAEDAVHDAFLKLWTGGTQFDAARGSMRGLLLTITRHTSVDVTRKRARRRRTESAYYNDEAHVTDGPESATERSETAGNLRDALRELPYEQRRAIEAAYFAGRSQREIAASSAVPIGTVKSRMRLGMRKLAATLCDMGGGEHAAAARTRQQPRATVEAHGQYGRE